MPEPIDHLDPRRSETTHPIQLRRATSADRAALEAGFEQLSSDSRVARFFTAMPTLSARMLDDLLDVDGDHHVAIVALAASNATKQQAQVLDRGVGVARYIRSATDPATAEIAVAVIDEHHGTGIGRLLLAALVDLASQNGIGTLTATVLADNSRMLNLLRSIGANRAAEQQDRTVVMLEVPVARPPTQGAELRSRTVVPRR